MVPELVTLQSALILLINGTQHTSVYGLEAVPRGAGDANCEPTGSHHGPELPLSCQLCERVSVTLPFLATLSFCGIQGDWT